MFLLIEQKNMKQKVISNYIRLINESGMNGLDKTAQEFLSVGLEHLNITGQSLDDRLATLNLVSNEAISVDVIKAFVVRIINYILNAYNEWRDSVKRKLNALIEQFREKYKEWEMDNVPFGDTEPLVIAVTNPYLSRGDEPLLKSNAVYVATDLVPNNNYRHFQIANGVMGLTAIGKALIASLKGDEHETSPESYLSDLIGELRELIQPKPEDNFGRWGLNNYDKNKLGAMHGLDFSNAYVELMKIQFNVGGLSESYELTVSDPSECIANIRAIKKQLLTIEKLLVDYKYIDGLEQRIKTAKTFFTSTPDDDYTPEFKAALITFQQSADLYRRFADINTQFMVSLSKSLIAGGDVYMKAYDGFRKQT